MNKLLLSLLAVGLVFSAPAAAVGTDDLPADTIWYLHADLAGMRASKSGGELYRWLQGEVFVEINEETGIDISRELDRVTAYSAEGPGVTVVLEGPVSKETQDKLMAIMAMHSDYDVRDHRNKTYFYAGDPDAKPDRGDPLGDLSEAAYVSFALKNKVVITSAEGQMQELLANGGRISGSGGHKGALFVLTADRSFVQAGLRTEHFSDDGDDWNSNILRNTEQAALLVAERGGLLAVEAQLKSRDARMAQSISSVVNGLIGLQAFNSDIDPGIRSLISNTKVSVADAVLSISTVIDPKALVAMLSD
jgi:hypothetical protein